MSAHLAFLPEVAFPDREALLAVLFFEEADSLKNLKIKLAEY